MKIAIFRYITEEKFDNSQGEKFRGYIGNMFKEEVILHNHLSLYEFLYKSPLVQYKVIEGIFCIVAINNGIDVIKDKLLGLQFIQIENEKYQVKNIEVEEKECEIKIGEVLKRYRFETLWIALNSENYGKYRSGQYDLNKALTNNLIEFFKMSGIWADKPILVNGVFKTNTITKKDTRLIGFSGEFVCNVDLPDFIGLGKRKSIGFGTIKAI